MSAAYYNEIDPFAAEWLRRLILFGHIAPGDVDERDIRDVSPDDLRGYEQHHFFAGIGVWSYALRRAGWADDRPVASVSAPCQPFSEAGEGGGFADERHLWPAFYHIARERRFPVVVGEQVADGRGMLWLDLVLADMEAADYTGGAIITPAACYGAPIERHRTYFVWMAEPYRERREGAAARSEPQGGAGFRLSSKTGGVGGPNRLGRKRRETAASGDKHDGTAPNGAKSEHGARQPSTLRVRGNSPGPVNGFWRNADWLGCKDGKFRPVEPGTFPLADGVASRVGLLRGYGNALNAEAATGFIKAVMECMP